MYIQSSRLTPLLLLVFASSIIISCGNQRKQGMPPGQQPAQPYPVLELQPRSIELTNTYPATLEGQQTVEIRPRVSGYITKMPVDEGDIVQKGELLFQLNSEEYEQEVRSAKANVQAAEASVNTAKDEVERLQRLVDQNIVSNYQLQSAKNTLKANEATLAQAEARLKNAQVNLGYTEVRSPVNGTIGTIPYRIGSLVSSNIAQPLTTVSDISNVYAYFSMSERELLEMAKSNSGQPAGSTIQQRVANMPKVDLILSDNSTYTEKGTLRLASGLINTETGSATFRAVFPNPKRTLLSGGSANVQIPFHRDSAIIIPKKATFEIQNKRFVYAVTDSNSVKSTAISVSPLSTKQLFVVESGLSVNDQIVTNGIGKLRNQAKIKPQPVDGDSLYQVLSKQHQVEQ